MYLAITSCNKNTIIKIRVNVLNELFSTIDYMKMIKKNAINIYIHMCFYW